MRPGASGSTITRRGARLALVTLALACNAARNEPTTDPLPGDPDAGVAIRWPSLDARAPADVRVGDRPPTAGGAIDAAVAADAADAARGGDTPGRFTEFPLPGEQPYPRFGGIVAGPDGAIWFTRADAKIGRLTTDGKLTLFALADRTETPGRILVGPDRNLWFTLGRAAVGRMTTGGASLVFDTATAASDIAVGPDGNLWVDQTDGLGQLTPAGGFRAVGLQVTVVEVAGGADGNVWVIIRRGLSYAVGRVTTGGVLTQVFSDSRTPVDITAGPDGNVWFALNNPTTLQTNAIVRIGPDQSTAQLAQAGYVSHIVAGRQADLWFFRWPDRIVHRGSDGTSLETPLPDAAFSGLIEALALDPDGALWIAHSTGKILRCQLPAPP